MATFLGSIGIASNRTLTCARDPHAAQAAPAGSPAALRHPSRLQRERNEPQARCLAAIAFICVAALV